MNKDHPNEKDGFITPNHYMFSKYETVEIIEDQLTVEQFTGFVKGLIIKYLCKDTENKLRNLNKANYYLTELINVLSKNESYDEKRINPQYFKKGKELEPINIIEDQFSFDELFGFYFGIILKYILRASHKHGLEDYVKAKYYLDRYIKILEKKEQEVFK